MPEEPNIRKLDARSLRGLAHPLRMELLNALRRRGPATASMLAERLGESSGATSYHLRQLAEYGFIADAPEHGKGRERWWKAAADGLTFDATELDGAGPELRGMAEIFLHEVAATHARELSNWLHTRERWSKDWIRSADMSDATLQLTPELGAELVDKMHALISDYRGRVTDDDPDAEQVRIHTHLFPIETD
ncbi:MULTISPECIES: helix-turn-helix domain-containing protein [Streptomyces]|nr:MULTISPECIES: helix-turn-helix domain-containing protein [Streptomyces]MYT06165.1 helix-turn-helix domain-containing protein [Streptomyces sp. SID5470]